MTDIPITISTPFYAAIFTFGFVLLSVRTLLLRQRLGIAIGHDDQPILARAVRAHANFVEYVPIALLLIFFIEITTTSTLAVHALCVLLLIGRLLHAYGVSQLFENYRYRVIGMALTFTVIISAAIRIIAAYLF